MFDSLAHYRIEAEIGEGAFATVYRAFDIRLERYIALKVLKQFWMTDARAVARFMQEARLMAKLEHPHIVTIHDVGQADGHVYLAQQLINGNSLIERIRQGAVPWAETLAIIRPVASALDYAHAHRLIHRDLKPQNILLGENEQVFLSDFGLVKATANSMSLSLSTGGGGMLGTPNYMAPEQWDDAAVTPATDIYALACVVTEMLTGNTLFKGSSPSVVMKRHLIDGPQFPDAWGKDVPPSISIVLARGLHQNPAKRFQSAETFINNLERLAKPTIAKNISSAITNTITQLPKPKNPSRSVLDATRTFAGKLLTRLKFTMHGWLSKILNTHRKQVVALIVSLLVVLGATGLGVMLSQRGISNIVITPPLAFVSNRDGNAEIYMMDINGETTRLTNNPAYDSAPNWAPDHKRLVFVSRRNGNDDIYTLNISTDKLQQLTAHSADDTEPAWSPDGRFIAFTSNRNGKREIYFAGPEKIVQVTHSPGSSESWEPAWIGSGILIFTSNRDGKREIYRTSTEATIRITHSPGKAESWAPHWSIFGNYILFSSNRDGKNEVYTLSDTAQAIRVTSSPGLTGSISPTGSPNGNSIVFTSNRSGNNQIYTIIDNHAKQLTLTGTNWSPAW